MKDIILGHKVERDELLRQGFVLMEGIEEARKSLDTNLIKVIIGPNPYLPFSCFRVSTLLI